MRGKTFQSISDGHSPTRLYSQTCRTQSSYPICLRYNDTCDAVLNRTCPLDEIIHIRVLIIS